jgi:hypothetical protein
MFTKTRYCCVTSLLYCVRKYHLAQAPPQTPNHMHKRLHYPAHLSRLESTVAQDSNVAGLARIHWSCIYESDLKTNTDTVQAP